MVTRAFYFKLYLMLIELEHKVDRVMVPLNRADQCNHAYRYGTVLTGSIVVPLTSASNEGRLWACCTLAR